MISIPLRICRHQFVKINCLPCIHASPHLRIVKIQFNTAEISFLVRFNFSAPVSRFLFTGGIQFQEMRFSRLCSLFFFLFSPRHFHKNSFRGISHNFSDFFHNLNRLPDCPLICRRYIKILYQSIIADFFNFTC